MSLNLKHKTEEKKKKPKSDDDGRTKSGQSKNRARKQLSLK